LGYRLGTELLAALTARDITEAKVVVGADNAIAIAAYKKMGFEPAGTMEVHPGETSMVLTWLA